MISQEGGDLSEEKVSVDELSNSLTNVACHLEREVEVTEAFRALLNKVPPKEVRIFCLLLTHVPFDCLA